MERFLCQYFVLCILLIQSCAVKDSRDEDDHNKAQTYAMEVYAVNEHIVNILNDIFYLDYCISDYGSNGLNQELSSIYFPEAEMISSETSISIDRHSGIKLVISTNGISIKENDSKWVVDAMISKLWGDFSEEGFRFTVGNVHDSYHMDGRIITNRLYEKGFFYSDINLTFTKDIVHIQFTDPAKPETYIVREVPSYIFDGSIACFFGDNGASDETEPSYDIEVRTLNGYDHKEYIGSEPIYDGTTYFLSGIINCIIHQKKQSNNKLIIYVKNEHYWELEYNNRIESYYPNNSPIRL